MAAQRLPGDISAQSQGACSGGPVSKGVPNRLEYPVGIQALAGPICDLPAAANAGEGGKVTGQVGSAWSDCQESLTWLTAVGLRGGTPKSCK